jgi:hypothetical protein
VRLHGRAANSRERLTLLARAYGWQIKADSDETHIYERGDQQITVDYAVFGAVPGRVFTAMVHVRTPSGWEYSHTLALPNRREQIADLLVSERVAA